MGRYEILSIRQPNVLIIHQVMHICYLLSISRKDSLGDSSSCRPTSTACYLLIAGAGIKKPMHQLRLITLDSFLSFM